jgi:hypothetical protein
MKFLKYLVLAVLFLSFIGSVSAQTKKRKIIGKSKSKTVQTIVKSSNAELKIIAEGTYSPVETPRILIARSAKDYAELRSLIENLPDASEIDFKKTAVVAAFAGTKNTGGYSVLIRRAAGAVKVEVVAPPKDAITTDALTQPFVVALVAAGEVSRIKYSNDWKNARQR